MIGAYISDDFYFHFESSDIQALEKNQEIKGTFAANSNKMHGQKIKMPIIVKAIHGNVISDIHIDYDKKVVQLILQYIDFEEWLVNPSDWVLHNGPNCRFASCNVHISQEKSFNQWKNEINIFLHT